MMLNNWALVSTSSGVPKRALEIYERILGILETRDPEGTLPPALIFNRARALESIGRIAEARAGYEHSLQLGRQTKHIAAEGLALAALAGVAERSGDRPGAVRYLRELDERLGASISSYAAMAARRDIVQGRLAAAEGNFAQARAWFDAALGAGKNSVWKEEVLLNKAEMELLAGDAASALAFARSALDGAASRQGGVPYSHNAGHAWLVIGRALRASGETAAAHDAFAAAADHLSNTVDPVHPALVRARVLLAEK
jgi:tetratricopeptide (TPR) repeat protein